MQEKTNPRPIGKPWILLSTILTRLSEPCLEETVIRDVTRVIMHHAHHTRIMHVRRLRSLAGSSVNVTSLVMGLTSRCNREVTPPSLVMGYRRIYATIVSVKCIRCSYRDVTTSTSVMSQKCLGWENG